MYQEVAFDPECLSEYHYYGLLKSEFGFEKGRYIVAPIKQWARDAFQAAKNSDQLKPVKKKSITNYLNKLQKSKVEHSLILPKYRALVNGDNWKDWCQKQIDVAPFNSIISESFNNAISYDDLIDGDARWVISPTVRVRKNAAEIISVIKPLIVFGGILTIVDQYFRLADNEVLASILSEVNSNDSIKAIKLVTSIETNNPIQVYNDTYAARYPNVPKFELIVSPERFFHDRYIISTLGSIKAGHGFSEGIEQGTQADLLSVSLCGNEEAKDTLIWVSKMVEEGKATTTVLHGG
jgi:hypothetical protein